MKNPSVYILVMSALILFSCSQRKNGSNAETDKATTTQTNVTDKIDKAGNAADNARIEFSMSDINGKTVAVTDEFAKHDITIVDFWASWCGPCRREMPNLVKTYNAFKDKGLGVIGVSLDDNIEQWKAAVTDMKMSWTQLSDLQGWNNAAAVKYGVNSIPFVVVVDKTGTVLQTNLRGEELEAFVASRLAKNK